MENKNKNEIKNLNENEVEKVAGGLKPLNKEKGHWVDSVCYKCDKKFKEYVIPRNNEGYCASMCPECMRKWREETGQKNIKVFQMGEILKKAKESTNR